MPTSPSGQGAVRVSICIATYRRPEKLDALLQDLQVQQRPPDEVIVVDNDADASAREVVSRHLGTATIFRLQYAVQPLKNISLTRNKTVELASGDWLAFIDDDERAPHDWLARLLEAAERYGADGVLGPVEPLLPESAPAWIKRGRFYDFPRMTTGSVIPPNRLRFGNVLVKGAAVRKMAGPFDPVYGLTGGEDGDMLSRLVQGGSRVIWCDEASVTEPVENSRQSLRWLLRRALSGGQDFARHTLGGRYGAVSAAGSALFLSRAFLQAIVAALLAMVTWPLGRHVAAKWLIKLSANLGKISAFSGWRYREYA